MLARLPPIRQCPLAGRGTGRLRQPGAPCRLLATAPRHLFAAGVLLAFYVLSITAIAPKFGVGNAIFFVLIGQLISAAVIDHFGLFGAQQIPLTWTHLSGLLLMATGVLLTQKA